jgi:putative membrane protein
VTHSQSTDPPVDVSTFRGDALAIRSLVGGVFMGLANLVPGISGGTMLLAVGVYPQFIGGVAEVSTLRFRPKVLLMLACVVGAAAIAIAGFAGPIGTLLDQYRWAMFGLFIGLTLGGVPVLWRVLRPGDGTVVWSAAVGIVLMALLAATDPERIGNTGEPGLAAYTILVVAGFSGGAAMILPGMSGAYLLLVLGQYRTILDAVEMGADGARAGEWAMAAQSLHVLVPVGVGVVLGVVGVSNLVKMLLARYQRATLGLLLGLLLGAVLGLWPFTDPVAPQIGDIIRGVELTTPELVAAVDPERWARVAIAPSLWQLVGGVALVLTGFGVSWGISHLGK